MKEGLNLKSKDINFEYIEDFADYVVNEVENDEDKFVTVIAKFDVAKKILKELMTYDDVNFESLQIESPIMDNYCDEFVLSLWMNDGVLEIGCEKLKNEDGEYTNPCGDVVFLFDDCSSKIIPLCDGSELYFVNIDDECDCDEECDCKCPCDCHKEEKEIAPTEKSHYSINGKPVSKAEFDKKYTELQKKYEKNMRSILDDYCDFMDEFNTLFARLW